MNHASTHSGKTLNDRKVQENLCGKELANCKIIKKLGQGAMGTVYLACQINLNREVALKVLDAKFSRDLVYIERFEREAQASARLLHFNVVQVYDFGRFNETYYIISEFVKGHTVQKMIDEQGTLRCENAAEMVLQASRGLAAAQEAGIVHRDIKPENLMINTEGVIKITDFGLAKVVKDDAGVTQSGMIVGTPFYMSPEQVKGEPLDARSDLYSLGITFFYMVTGQIPFDGPSVISVLMKHISGERPKPTDINPSVPEIVSDVILKMMESEPDARYEGFEELTAVLEKLLEKLRSGETGENTLSFSGEGIDAKRAKRYKNLQTNLVASLKQRQIPAQLLKKMVKNLTSDSGVFVEGWGVYPENTVVDLRFTVPGRSGLVEALGVVRWSMEQGHRKGVGVSLLRINTIDGPKPKIRDSAVVRRSYLSSTKIIKLLTDNPLKGRLLRYYYANTGRTVTVNKIANALGVGTRSLEAHLSNYRSLGLAVNKGKTEISFVWPDDKEVQNIILDWIEKHGLR